MKNFFQRLEEAFANEEDEEEFEDGDEVILKPRYEETPGEVFKVSQCDPERGRCWIGDEDGRGWYVRFHQITHLCDGEGEE